jgi:hypothetical protein
MARTNPILEAKWRERTQLGLPIGAGPVSAKQTQFRYYLYGVKVLRRKKRSVDEMPASTSM